MSKKEKAEPKKHSRLVVSEILADGRMVEMLYDETSRKTKFAVSDGSKVETCDLLETIVPQEEVLLPYAGWNQLVSRKIILFPSGVERYGTDRELVERIQAFVHNYLDVTPLFEKLAPYYVMFTWVYEQFNELPYLRALGDFGSGKSRFLQVIGSLCYKPMFAGGATTVSPIFRIIDQFKGTLVLDEADYRFSDTTAEIAKILNSGYQKGVPVLRTEGDEHREVKGYDVFCPKIIATRERFSDTALESRFLIEEMEKRNLRKDIPINLPTHFWEEARSLRNQLLQWRFDNFSKVKLNTEVFDAGLVPRLNQILMPLLSIVDDESFRKEIGIFMQGYNSQLVVDRGMGSEVDILLILMSLHKSQVPEPLVKVITTQYNETMPLVKDQMEARKVGSILRSKLKMTTRRTARGIVVPEIENKAKIDSLKDKYGITDDAVMEEIKRHADHLQNGWMHQS